MKIKDKYFFPKKNKFLSITLLYFSFYLFSSKKNFSKIEFKVKLLLVFDCASLQTVLGVHWSASQCLQCHIERLLVFSTATTTYQTNNVLLIKHFLLRTVVMYYWIWFLRHYLMLTINKICYKKKIRVRNMSH